MKCFTFHRRAGQNTVEYLLMLAVIVGVVLVTGSALKRYMPSLFGQLTAQIGDTVQKVGGGSGNAN